VDWEKAFDRIPREVIRWAMRKSRVEEWLVSAETVVRTAYGNGNNSEIKVSISPTFTIKSFAICNCHRSFI